MYCPSCGTNNRDGSKFCNNCGAPLAARADVACPACGTANPVNTAFCSNCGARLESLARAERKSTVLPIKGLSLPTKGKPAPSESAASDSSGTQNDEARNVPPAGSAQEAAPFLGADVPDWLAQLRAVPPVEEETTPPLSSDVPDWIKHLQSIRPDEATPAPSRPVEQPPMSPAPSQELAGLPGWLVPSDESSWVPQQEPAETPARPIDEQPAPGEANPSALPVPPTEALLGALPTELAEGGMAPTAAGSTTFPAEEETTQELDADTGTDPGLPAWLQGLETQEPTVSEATTAEETASEESAQAAQSRPGMPDWLVAETTGEQQPNLEGIPEWLRMAMPAEEPLATASEELFGDATTAEAESAAVEGEEPSAEPVYQVLDRVAPRASAVRMPAGASSPEAQPIEQGNVLAGLRGVLPLAVAVAEPHVGAEKPAVAAMNEKDDGARLFEAILAEAPAEEEPAPKAPAPRAFGVHQIIYLVLALAVIVPFFLPRSLAGSLLRISKTPAAEVYDLIQALPPDSTVLVAFDYEPSMTGEMDLLAKAMMRHLVQRHLKIIAVSTLDTGPQIAQEIISSAIANNKDYRYGAEYLNFGYIPGHEAGLASFAANGLPPNKDYGRGLNIRQYPITVDMKSPNDVALIIELAGSEDALRMWMEQVQPRVGTRIIAGVSAAVEPKAQVYKRPAQLAGLVSGLVGAAQLEVLSNQPGQALTSVNAQTAAQVVLILVIVAGNIVYWVSRASRGKTGAAAEKAK